MERHELNKGKKLSDASQLSPKSVTTEARNNCNFNKQMSELSPSNCQAAISNYEVHSPSSNRLLRPETEVVAAESKLGTANLMRSAQKCSDLVNKSNAFESKKSFCPDINADLSVPGTASAVTKTKGGTLESPQIKRKLSDLSLVAQLSGSKSRILGFRSKDLEQKSSLNDASVGRVGKLKGN
jgi:hypothetical protein